MKARGFGCRYLQDLQQRGVKDVLIACTDNLKGFCWGHRNSIPPNRVPVVHCPPNPAIPLKRLSYKHVKEVIADLKLVLPGI